jgi:hypothetical protein
MVRLFFMDYPLYIPNTTIPVLTCHLCFSYVKYIYVTTLLFRVD